VTATRAEAAKTVGQLLAAKDIVIACGPGGVGKPARWVHRQHEHAAALLHHRGGGQRRRRRGLAHPARPARDDDVLGREQLSHRLDARRAGGRHSPSSSPRARATWRVVRAPKLRAKR